MADRRRLTRLRSATAVLLATLACVTAARAAEPDENAAQWAVPEEGCRPADGLRADTSEETASPVFLLAPGAKLDAKRLDALRRFVPKEVWEQRERFFHAGMRLVVGPCFRDYAPPDFFARATEKQRGQARLTEEGGLADHVAGLPFPPDTIDPAASDAGLRWAWNAAERYRAGGLRGRFRVTDLVGKNARAAEPLEGELSWMELTRRADRPDARYRVPFAKGKLWVAAGVLQAPDALAGYAWRHFRDADTRIDLERADELHAFRPEWERVRRLPAPDDDALALPSYTVELSPTPGVSLADGAGRPGGALEARRSGFEWLALRPLRWSWRVAGLDDLVAPIDVAKPMWPEDPERDFGPFGLSFASDRWELRRTLVLDARAAAGPRPRGEVRQRLWLDLQTLVPLFAASWDEQNRLVDVAVFAYRWSEDRADTPRWLDDRQRPVRVLDSVALAVANLGRAGSFRRESWDVVSVPPADDEVERLGKVTSLAEGR